MTLPGGQVVADRSPVGGHFLSVAAPTCARAEAVAAIAYRRV